MGDNKKFEQIKAVMVTVETLVERIVHVKVGEARTTNIVVDAR